MKDPMEIVYELKIISDPLMPPDKIALVPEGWPDCVPLGEDPWEYVALIRDLDAVDEV